VTEPREPREVALAVDAVACNLIAKALRDAIEFDRIGWEHYPDLCMADYEAVVKDAREIVASWEKAADEYQRHYALLAARANEQEPQS
jgi:hypothetical protein